MLHLAFLGSDFGEQLRSNPEALSGVEVLWVGDQPEAFAKATEAKPAVVVCTLRSLGASPRQRIDEMLSDPQLERVVVNYAFAPRSVLNSLQDPRVRVVQGPLSLANLRAQLVDLIIRDILADDANSRSPMHTASCPECGATL